MTSVSRPLRPGDVVLEAEPFAHMLTIEFWGKRCHFCLKECKALKRCSGCMTFSYCGKDCQVKDWKAYHKLGECRAYKNLKDANLIELWSKHSPKYGLSLTMRMYFLCKSKPEMMDKKYILADGTTRTFRDLMTHKEEFETTTDGRWIHFLICTYFRSSIPDLDIEFFCECLHKQHINSYLLEAPQYIATGLYIEASVFDHSCRPNAIRSYIGTKMFLRVIRDIPAGEPIFVTYAPLALPRELRQQKLDSFFFECKCERCMEGDAPDYGEKRMELQRMSDSMPSLEERKRDRRASFELEKRYCELFEEMIGVPYLVSLTENMMDVVTAAMKMQRTPEDMQYMRPFMSKAREHMLVTHGPEHPMFKTLMMCCLAIEWGKVM